MKNKKLIYVLLPLMIGVWGTILFKVISIINRDSTPVIQNTIYNKNNAIEEKVDSFFLIANYPDPFLRHKKIKNTNKISPVTTNKRNVVIKEKKEKRSDIKWPLISYCGLVNTTSENRNLCFIKIDNEDHLMKQGDIIKGIKLELIFKDSVKVSYKNDLRIIKKM